MAAARVKEPKFVLVVGLNQLLAEKVTWMETQPVEMFRVDTCEKALRYLDASTDILEVWVSPTALGTRNAELFERALKIRHPGLIKVSFVATSNKDMKDTPPHLHWKLLPA